MGLVIFVSELCDVVYISLNVQYMHLGCPVAMSCNSNTTRQIEQSDLIQLFITCLCKIFYILTAGAEWTGYNY